MHIQEGEVDKWAKVLAFAQDKDIITYDEIDQQVEHDPQAKAMITKLEDYYESRIKKKGRAKFSPEAEKFLKKLEKRFEDE